MSVALCDLDQVGAAVGKAGRTSAQCSTRFGLCASFALVFAIVLGIAGFVGQPAQASSRSPAIGAGEVPAGFTKGGWDQIEARLPLDRHEVRTKGSHQGRISRPGAFYPARRFTPAFNGEGVVLASATSGSDWRLPVTLSGYGYAGRLAPVANAQPRVSQARVEYRRGDVTEWYVNARSGLEQGFTLAKAPAAPTGHANSFIELVLGVGGGFKPGLDSNGVVLQRSRGGPVIHYTGLVVRDASGRALPARMAVAGHKILLRFDSRRARFPVVVDPTFTEEAQLLPSDAALGDSFGSSVALSGDTAVIGAFQKDGRAGAVYVFTRSGTAWTEQQKLTASDAASNDFFGVSVALSGDTIVVGASGKGGDTGAAYVFTRTGATWAQQQKLTAPDAPTNAAFGSSVALSGDTAVVGADSKNSSQGATYVFTRAGTSWTEQQELTASDAANNDEFGARVAVSGDTAMVVAIGRNSGAGAVYVFTRTGASWTEQQKLTTTDPPPNSVVGNAITLSGDTAVVGAIDSNLFTGAAYVFTRSGTSWTEQQKLTASDAAPVDSFGVSVGLFGDTVIVGANGKDSGKGAAYVFSRTGAAWSQQQKLIASDGVAPDFFGISVATSGDTSLVGAYLKNSAEGAAYVFPVTVIPPAPTLSVWGLGVLAALLTGAGLLVGRRPAPRRR